MPQCSYCEETVDDEEAYLAHLRDAHEGELSRIDRRRVEQASAGDGRSRAVVYLAVGVVVLLLAAAVYVTAFGGGDGEAAQPDGVEAEPLPDRGNQALLSDVQRFSSEGTDHVPAGTQVEYATSPPTSGPHYNDPAGAGFYEEAPAAGHLVHSLEHGAVVIYYDPAALDPDAEESLREFAAAHDDPWATVIVVPNPADDPESPYVLTAWRTMLRMDGYDAEVVRAFLADYLGRGPEHPVR